MKKELVDEFEIIDDSCSLVKSKKKRFCKVFLYGTRIAQNFYPDFFKENSIVRQTQDFDSLFAYQYEQSDQEIEMEIKKTFLEGIQTKAEEQKKPFNLKINNNTKKIDDLFKPEEVLTIEIGDGEQEDPFILDSLSKQMTISLYNDLQNNAFFQKIENMENIFLLCFEQYFFDKMIISFEFFISIILNKNTKNNFKIKHFYDFSIINVEKLMKNIDDLYAKYKLFYEISMTKTQMKIRSPFYTIYNQQNYKELYDSLLEAQKEKESKEKYIFFIDIEERKMMNITEVFIKIILKKPKGWLSEFIKQKSTQNEKKNLKTDENFLNPKTGSPYKKEEIEELIIDMTQNFNKIIPFLDKILKDYKK